MNHPHLVRIFQGVQYLQNHCRGSLWPKPTGYLLQSVEPRAVDIFHRDKRYLVVFGEIEGRRNVRVKKSASGARSTSETVAPSLRSAALRQFAPQDLDCHGPVQNRIITAKDDAHRARGEPLVNAVTANGENRVHLVTCQLPGGSTLDQPCISSIFKDSWRLRRILLNEVVSEPISSLLRLTSTGVLSFPKLTSLAMLDISLTGFTTIKLSSK